MTTTVTRVRHGRTSLILKSYELDAILFKALTDKEPKFK